MAKWKIFGPKITPRDARNIARDLTREARRRGQKVEVQDVEAEVQNLLRLQREQDSRDS